VDGLEHKMGLHASPTCALRYEGATGWLLGQPHRGLAAMFLMMNSARLHVGLQGLGHQEMATQNALRHAFERTQFKATIGSMPAMRHILLRLQALAEGQRVIAYAAALAIDEAAHHADAAQRDRQNRRAALLTPLVKALLTQTGFDSASAALQVYGGYGYTRDFGIEQTLRDVRITLVYEGTNQIQAIDLLQRKVLADGGRALDELLADFEAEAARVAAHGLDDFATALNAQIAEARVTTAALKTAAGHDAEAPLRVADAYLQGLSHLLLAWAWAASARATTAEPDTTWAAAKLARTRHGVAWLLPDATAHWARARATGAALAAAAG
jgi:Acyl-CoA dehydrogenase, C-terminal domain